MTEHTTRKPPTETEKGLTATPHNKRSRGADRNADIVLGAAVIAMGLLAGLFYAFDVAVMPGLSAAGDRTLVDACPRARAVRRPPPLVRIFALGLVQELVRTGRA